MKWAVFSFTPDLKNVLYSGLVALNLYKQCRKCSKDVLYTSDITELQTSACLRSFGQKVSTFCVSMPLVIVHVDTM